MHNVRYWHKADIPSCTAHVPFGGKADIEIVLRRGRMAPPNEELRKSFRRVATALSWARSLMGSRWRCEGRGPPAAPLSN